MLMFLLTLHPHTGDDVYSDLLVPDQSKTEGVPIGAYFDDSHCRYLGATPPCALPSVTSNVVCVYEA